MTDIPQFMSKLTFRRLNDVCKILNNLSDDPISRPADADLMGHYENAMQVFTLIMSLIDASHKRKSASFFTTEILDSPQLFELIS